MACLVPPIYDARYIQRSKPQKTYPLLQDRYERICAISRCTSNSIYLYRDIAETTGRKVVLKKPNRAVLLDQAAYNTVGKLLAVEGRALSRINHPGVVSLISQGDGYLLLEYVHGKNLHDNKRSMSESAKLKTMLSLCDALSAVHAAGIIHRDIKPANVVYNVSSTLLDFGCAKGDGLITESESAENGGVTDYYGKAAFVGTIDFCPPENNSPSDVGKQSDLFSAGGVLYYLLTGDAPYECKDDDDIYGRKLVTENDIASKVPRKFLPVLSKALQPLPENRHQSAEELKEDLLRI